MELHRCDRTIKQNQNGSAAAANEQKRTDQARFLSEKVGRPVDSTYADDCREFVGLRSAEEHAVFERSRAENSDIADVLAAACS